MNDLDLNLLDPETILGELYGKELNSKKNILEYIDIITKIDKSGLDENIMQGIYNNIYKSIDGMKAIVKTNTIMHLKNQLRKSLGKFVKEKDPKEVDYFIEFFKEAYPPNKRKKDFTYVLLDKSRITNEQVWNTLTYINTICLKDRRILNSKEREHIIPMVEKLLKCKNIKYVNQMKSLTKLHKALKIQLVDYKGEKIIKKI